MLLYPSILLSACIKNLLAVSLSEADFAASINALSSLSNSHLDIFIIISLNIKVYLLFHFLRCFYSHHIININFTSLIKSKPMLLVAVSSTIYAESIPPIIFDIKWLTTSRTVSQFSWRIRSFGRISLF